MQNFDRFLGRLLDGIGNRHESGRSIVDGDKHHRVAFSPQLLGAREQRSWIDRQLLQERQIAERNRMSVHFSNDTFAGERTKILGRRKRHSFFLGRRDNRRGQRMLAAALQARSQAQDLFARLCRQR